VLDVISAVDEKVDSTQCEGRRNCHGDEPCVSHELWQSLSDQIRLYLDGITLAQVVTDYQSKRSGDKVIQFDVV
jgi:Rrf2 family iron-sulfur cluster assembly transcriptional regulator